MEGRFRSGDRLFPSPLLILCWEESHQFIALHVFSLLTPQHFRLPSSVFSLLYNSIGVLSSEPIEGVSRDPVFLADCRDTFSLIQHLDDFSSAG